MTSPARRRPPDPPSDGASRPDGDSAAHLERLVRWRRDVHRFQSRPLEPGAFDRLLALAALAPPVGLSQPWRFVLVEDPARRLRIRQNFESCNARAALDLAGQRAEVYARLKLGGLDEAPCQFAVFADRGTLQGARLGRGTMPETIEYSAVIAVHTLWLAARAEGLGLGWLSILDPSVVATALDVPEDWSFIGYFCLGYPAFEDDAPALQCQGWERRSGEAPWLLRR